MHLRDGEQIRTVFHHHPTPFILSILRLILWMSPFFVFLYWFRNQLLDHWYLWSNLTLLFVFACIVTYRTLIYWLDKFVVTNMRVIYIEWKYLTVRHESEAMLDDIQDIRTLEKGILSGFWLLDYGDFILQTASSKITITFDLAPDPEGIRKYIYHIRQQ